MPRLLVCCLLSLTVLLSAPGTAHADAIRDGQWMLDALDLETAHTLSTGEGVTIGLVDTGVNPDHPDLVGNVDAGMATWDDGQDGLIDVHGHGTAMASLAVGHGNGEDNDKGVLGAAPGARILSAGIMDAANLEEAEAGGSWFGDAEVAPAVRWLADNGADIILMSISGDFGPTVAEAVRYAAVDKDVLVVACSGNIDPHGERVRAPANYDEALAVAGTDSTGGAWDGATIGPTVDLAAPAANVVVADYQGGYVDYYGTSNSAAIVAGVAALLLSLWPDMSREDLTWRLTRTAVDAGEPGRDDAFGHGVIDPVAALTKVIEPPTDRPDADVNPAPIGHLKANPSSLTTITTLVVGGGAMLAVVWTVFIGFTLNRRRTRTAVASPVVSTGPPPFQQTPHSPPFPRERPPSDSNLSGPRHWP